MVERHSSQPILDEKAKDEYEARLEELEEAIAEARDLRNEEQQIRLEKERDAILDQLRSAVRLHGKDRELGSGSPARRAAAAVRKALDRALGQMAKHGMTELADHLSQTIRPEGNAFAYRPAPPVPPWEL